MTNSNFQRSLILWLAAVVITLSSVVYQRMTGPTHPMRGKLEVNGEKLKYKLLRSHETTSNAIFKIPVADTSWTALFKWRRYKSHDSWTTDTLKSIAGGFQISIPQQPAAGKVEYLITLKDDLGNDYPLSSEPVIIRFKGAVPGFVLLPHVLLMFFSMLLGVRTGLEAIANGKHTYGYALWTTTLLFFGGLIFGPLVQKFAFDAYWTGWPFGHDLTDNKTAVAFVFWLIALWQGKKPGRGRMWFVIAAVVQLLVYLIPHSLLGSELDYTKRD
ncbi:MAG TPA: hypothetical protein ENN22_14515 [bacterium]|nr:hypothetical protein [bacterium]